jgi:hypothetical protein
MDLQKFHDDLMKSRARNKIITVPTRSSSYLGQDLIRSKELAEKLKLERIDLTDSRANDTLVLVLSDVELPKIYRRENEDGSFEVLAGKSILDTVYSVLLDEEAKNCREDYNKFWLVNLQFVTFDATVSAATARFFSSTGSYLLNF